MKGLKPCPFCGSEYQTVEDLGVKPASECHAGKHWYVINCLDCGDSMRGFGRKEMIAAWNMRAHVKVRLKPRGKTFDKAIYDEFIAEV